MDLKTFRNIFTGETIVQPKPIDQEVPYDGSVMLCEFDPRGIITYTNKNFRLMYGYTKDELVGCHHSLLCHPDIPESLLDHMWETVNSGYYWCSYVKNLRKDGRHFWSTVWIKPLQEENGAITGYITSHKLPDPQIVRKIETNLKKSPHLTPEHFNAFALPPMEVESGFGS